MKKTALITGASSGLGLEFAKIYAKQGYHLVLVARNEGKLYSLKSELEKKYQATVHVFAKDLSLDDSPFDVFDYVLEHHIVIDTLINNAGFGDFGTFAHSDLQKQTDMVHVNVLTLMQLCHLFLKPMIQRGNGNIINMCSIAGFQPGAMMSTYYATKAFVLSFSEAISVELKGTGVSVMALCPGPTKTGFEEKADLGMSGLFKNIKNSTAKEVAEFGYKKMKKKKVVAVHGINNKIIVFGSKILPRKVVRNLVYKIQN
ncbi:MAG TPA: SDR family oxidoreductase [Candidatus Merdenecus merdavium]|nr:SDR family oxidoreductase [Candidatus Merdenecus merdavium]